MEEPAQHSADWAEIEIPRGDGCAAYARDAVRARIGDSVNAEQLDNALLVTSELVTNAWRHGEGAIGLRMERLDGRLRLEVIDEGSGATRRIQPQNGDASGGWGLRLVDELAVEWGSFEGTTHVWAEIEFGASPDLGQLSAGVPSAASAGTDGTK